MFQGSLSEVFMSVPFSDEELTLYDTCPYCPTITGFEMLQWNLQ
jgi:hypothetical protein